MYAAFVLVLVTIGAGGCIADGSTGPADLHTQESEIDLTATEAGAVHNEGLAHVFASLAERKRVDGRITREALVATAAQACREFLREHRLSVEACAPVDRVPDDAALTRPGSLSAAWTSASAMDSVVIDPLVYDYFAQLEDEWDAGVSPATFDALVQSIEADALQNLSGDDLDLVLAVTSVSVSTAYYWESEIPAWLSLADDCEEEEPWMCLPEPEFTDPGDVLMSPVAMGWCNDWCQAGNNTIMADIGGAIGGGIGARLLKAVVPQAAAAGVLGASTAAAIYEVYQILAQ